MGAGRTGQSTCEAGGAAPPAHQPQAWQVSTVKQERQGRPPKAGSDEHFISKKDASWESEQPEQPVFGISKAPSASASLHLSAPPPPPAPLPSHPHATRCWAGAWFGLGLWVGLEVPCSGSRGNPTWLAGLPPQRQRRGVV